MWIFVPSSFVPNTVVGKGDKVYRWEGTRLMSAVTKRVADATMAAIAAGAVRLIRGGDQRYEMMMKAIEDPVSVDNALPPEKKVMGELPKDHSSL